MKNLRFLKHIATGVSVLVLAAACTGDSGSEGNLRFKDKSGVTNNQVLPVAQGRTVNYTITNTAFNPKNQDVEDAESSDELVFTIKSFSGSSVSIEGESEGTATLTVTTEKGVRDRLDIEVRTRETTYYTVNKLNEGDVEQGIIDVAGKYNLTPGDEVSFEKHMFVDENGERLSGEEENEFEEGTEGATRIAARTLTGGAVGEALSVNNAYGGTLSVRTVDDYAPKSLVGYMHMFGLGELDASLLRIQSGTTFDLSGGGLHNLQVHAKDANGYAYIGATDLNAHVKIKTPGPVKMTYTGRTDEDAGNVCVDNTTENGCVEWDGLKDLSFMINVKDEDATSVELEISTEGLTQTMTLNL